MSCLVGEVWVEDEEVLEKSRSAGQRPVATVMTNSVTKAAKSKLTFKTTEAAVVVKSFAITEAAAVEPCTTAITEATISATSTRRT